MSKRSDTGSGLQTQGAVAIAAQAHEDELQRFGRGHADVDTQLATVEAANIGVDAHEIGLGLGAAGGQAVDRSITAMKEINRSSERISEIIQVISEIASQTNLLALNAAIEAARAGEQGRGFAVVADEVRLLAQRTQKSTAEIQGMIERLQGNSEAAVKVINESSRASQQTIEQASQAGASLTLIANGLRNLTGLNASIASATLQQSHVVEDINQNVTQAASLAHNNALAAEQSSEAGRHLGQLAEQLNGLLGQFRV